MISAFAFLSLMIISSGEAETARVWIGSLPLCEATVSEVATGGPDQWGNQDVNISLHSSASAELARITQKAVGQELSVIADGEIKQPNAPRAYLRLRRTDCRAGPCCSRAFTKPDRRTVRQ